ncbi:MAG TPA: hypothetical protein VJ981_00400 [Gammaproteobacteria bacterium]|nr:hypothetical protein [Gammaproteobacteria bacterium]
MTTRNIHNRPGFVLVSCLLVIVLVYAGTNAIRTMAAELTAYPVIHRMRIDFNRPSVPATQERQDMLAKLHKAVALQPDNPFLLRWLGNAYMQGYRYTSNSDRAAIAARQDAVRYFRQAIALRPSWPHDRIDYLLAKFRLGEIDGDFYRQLLYANRLGPWEAWVQQITAEIGLQLGERLPGDMQEIITDSILNGVQHPLGYGEMLEILRRYNSLDRVCGEVSSKQVRVYCDRFYTPDHS